MSDGHGLPREQMLRPRTFFMHRRVVAVCAPLIAWSQPHWMASGGGEGGDGGGGGGGEGGGFGVGEGGGGGGGGWRRWGHGRHGWRRWGHGRHGWWRWWRRREGWRRWRMRWRRRWRRRRRRWCRRRWRRFGMAPPNIVFQGLWQEVCGHCGEPSSAGPSFAVGQMRSYPSCAGCNACRAPPGSATPQLLLPAIV